jgi:hypothetical protein
MGLASLALFEAPPDDPEFLAASFDKLRMRRSV